MFATRPLHLRLCCKSLLSISAGNIDSRSGVNTQQRFKRTDVLIRLFQTSISQSPLGDFCNTIPSEADMTGSPRDVAQVPKAVITPAGRSRLFQRNLDLAIHALFHERESDPATEFVRNEIAYEIGAVAGVSCSRHRRAAQFAPYQDQVRGCASVQLALPTHRHSTTRD